MFQQLGFVLFIKHYVSFGKIQCWLGVHFLTDSDTAPITSNSGEKVLPSCWQGCSSRILCEGGVPLHWASLCFLTLHRRFVAPGIYECLSQTIVGIVVHLFFGCPSLRVNCFVGSQVATIHFLWHLMKLISCACICFAACFKRQVKDGFFGLHVGNCSCLFSKAVRSIESSEVCIVALRDRCRFVLQRCTEKLHDCIAAEERGSFLPWVAHPKIVVGSVAEIVVIWWFNVWSN